jgi:hypothetical protein
MRPSIISGAKGQGSAAQPDLHEQGIVGANAIEQFDLAIAAQQSSFNASAKRSSLLR